MHVTIGPVAMSSKFVVIDRCIETSIDEDRGGLGLRLSAEHHNISLIVIKVIPADLNVLPRLVKTCVIFIRSC